MTMTGLVGGRVVPGAVQHCAHGKGSTVHEIVDWRPFDYVTWHIGTPMGTVARQTADSRRSRMAARTCRCAAREWRAQTRSRKPGAGDDAVVAAKKLVREQRASKTALEGLVAEECGGHGGVSAGGLSKPAARL